jgi:hypothetical protein
MSTGTKYVINGELTEHAQLTPGFIAKCSFSIGSASEVKINENENGSNKPKTTPTVQYYQKFIEVTYPNGEKSTSCILPDCVLHFDLHEYYGKPSVYLGVPQAIANALRLKFAKVGEKPQFQDKRILSDEKYWWMRISMADAPIGKEFIRVVEPTEDLYYGSFADLFTEYQTSVICNVTCTLKLKGEAPIGEPLKGSEEWRVGIQVTMITPYDSIELNPPTSGAVQRSIAGEKDKAKSGLLKFKRVQPNGQPTFR